MRGGLAGQVRVLSNTNALTEFLPEALSSFLAAHPNVSVDLEERLSDEIVGLIAEGVGDIGIVAGTVDAGRLTHLSVPQRPLRAGGGARPSAGAARKSIGFAEVLDHDFVGLDRASAIQRFLADKAGRIGRPLRLRVQLRSFDAVCRLVECNVGVGIVPETTAQRTAEHHGDQGGASRRPLGAARTDHLRARLSRRCRPTRGNWSIICGPAPELRRGWCRRRAPCLCAAAPRSCFTDSVSSKHFLLAQLVDLLMQAARSRAPL